MNNNITNLSGLFKSKSGSYDLDRRNWDPRGFNSTFSHGDLLYNSKKITYRGGVRQSMMYGVPEKFGANVVDSNGKFTKIELF